MRVSTKTRSRTDIVRLHRHADDLGRRVSTLEDAARQALARGHVAAAVVSIVLLFVALPEALGDRLFDPRPSRVIHISLVIPR